MEISNLLLHIEALIFASDKPLSVADIIELINSAAGAGEDRTTEEQVQAAVEGIMEKYRSELYPFEVRQSGGGWQFLTKKEYHKTVAQLNGEKFLKRLSAASLETLAIIAYKQPITKGEIETIRGVNCDYSVQKLLEKELIVITGRNEQLPGHPLIYATSRSFMDYFGINSPEDLPRIREVFAGQAVVPTAVDPAPFESSTLVVTDNGELVGTTTADENDRNDAADNETTDGKDGNDAADNGTTDGKDGNDAADNGTTDGKDGNEAGGGEGDPGRGGARLFLDNDEVPPEMDGPDEEDKEQ